MRNARKISGSQRPQDSESRVTRRKRAGFRNLRNARATTAKPAEPPSPELAPLGPHPTDSNRDARGRFTRNNNGHLSHGAESEQRALMLAPERQAERALILDGLGLTETDVTRPLSYAIDRLVEAHFIAQSYIAFLAASGGVITSKGRQRRAVDGWGKAADRVAKFAQLVGLERRTRDIKMSTRDWLLSQREAEPAPGDGSTGTGGTGTGEPEAES
jgi:hypothetical protein